MPLIKWLGREVWPPAFASIVPKRDGMPWFCPGCPVCGHVEYVGGESGQKPHPLR